MGFLGAILGPAIGWGLNELGIGGSPAKVGPTSPAFRRAEQIGDLSKNYAFDYFLPSAQKAYNQVLPYEEGILSGNRSDIMSTLSPEIGMLKDQNAQTAANISKFTPGGGGQTTALSELPFRQEAQISNLINTARPQAAQALTGIAGQMAGEGLQAGGLSLNAVSDQINALLGKASQDIPLQQQTGAGIYQLLQQMLGQGGGGGGGSTDVGVPMLPGEGGGGGAFPGE